MTETPDTSHAVVRHFRSSKAQEAEREPSLSLLPPPPAVSAAAVAWAERQQHAILPAAAGASGGAVSALNLTAVPFPALAGLPAAPALGREVEQAAVQALEWQTMGAQGGDQGLPDIFKKPPPAPLQAVELPPLAHGGEEEQQPLQHPPARARKRGAGAGGAAGAAGRAYYGSTTGGGLGGGMCDGDTEVKREPAAATSTSNSQSFSYPVPLSRLLGGPRASPALLLHPEGGGEPVPIFEEEVELLKLALFDEEEEGAWVGGEGGEGGAGAAGGRGI